MIAPRDALLVWVVMTVLALSVFGYMFTVKKPVRSAWQIMALEGLAAAAAFLRVKLFG